MLGVLLFLIYMLLLLRHNGHIDSDGALSSRPQKGGHTTQGPSSFCGTMQSPGRRLDKEFTRGFGRVIVVGAGPVGSFVSVLVAYLGVPVTCYEKREEFTRKIKLNIAKGFFGEVQKTLDNLGVRSNFFREMDRYLSSRGNKVVISELERMLNREALSTRNLEYKTEEVASFSEVYERHRGDNPLILDCTGRNSRLRVAEFGDDAENIITTPLQHAIYINLKAKNTRPVNLYPAMKNIRDVLLTNITVGDHRERGMATDVTIPVFISGRLADIFDRHCPNTNKRPFNPFDASCSVPDDVLYLISSIVGTLVLEGWEVDFGSVSAKKIEISCGYAKRRSSGRYVCLGDSAVHLAFFRSLNLGLWHALEFFVSLSTYCGEPNATPVDEQILRQFRRDNMVLHPMRVFRTCRRNSYMVVTKVLLYGCFHYCLTNHRTVRLTSLQGIRKAQVDDELRKLNARLCDWSSVLGDFESRRKIDIDREVKSNLNKNDMYKYISWVIDVNGSSPIKISEVISMACRGYFLSSKSFAFFLKCIKVLKRGNVPSVSKDSAVEIVLGTLSEYQNLVKGAEGTRLPGWMHIAWDTASSVLHRDTANQDRTFVRSMISACKNSESDAEEKLRLVKRLLEESGPSTRNMELNFVKKLIRNVVLLCDNPS